MRKPNAVLAAVVAAAFMVSGCISVQRAPVPGPEARDGLDIRGVIVGECPPDGPGCETFEYSEVHDVRWTETSLVITGAVHAPGEDDHGQITTVTFPLAEVSEVLVSETAGTRSSIIVAGILMGASVIITFLVTGKSQDGVPIGSSG